MADIYTLDMAIRKLESMYPDFFPRNPLSEREMGVRIGALEVIQHLRAFRDNKP